MTTFTPTGICPNKIHFDIHDGLVRNVKFDGGCPGNLQAISRLVEGMSAVKVAELLKGVTCGNKSTSCSDQLAQALEADVKKRANC